MREKVVTQLTDLLPDVSLDKTEAVLNAYDADIQRLNICSHLHWGSSKYSTIVKPVLDAEGNFRQRWNEVVMRHELDYHLLVPDHSLPPALESASLVQVARTIPAHTYSFAPENGMQGIAQLYVHALSNAQRFVYLENQYFWTHAFYGIDLPRLGIDSTDMEHNIAELTAALQRGANVAIVLPNHLNMGRAFTDAGLARLRIEVPEAAVQGLMQAFCLAASATVEGEEVYRPIYVHAKVAIIDDSSLGSGNLNNRGMRNDTEMNVTTLNAELARGLGMLLWAEHLELVGEESMMTIARHLGHQRQRRRVDEEAAALLQHLQETLGYPLAGLHLMIERAQDNLRRFKAKQPLVGLQLPYVTGEEAKQQGWHFHEEHGWIEVP